MNRMNMRKSIKIFLLLILAVVAWRILRVHLYLGGRQMVVLPNGSRVAARLLEAQRLPDNVVRVTLELKWKPLKGRKLLLPDMSITRPHATISPRQSDSGIGDGYANYTAYFHMNEVSDSVDIVQPIRIRKPEDTVYVDFPINGHTSAGRVKQVGSARIQYVDSGNGRKYASDQWLNEQVEEKPSPDSLCVRIKQTDSDGPLREWAFFAFEMDTGGSCTAELVDEHGHALPQSGCLIAKSDCTLHEGTQYLIPGKERLHRNLIHFLSFGHVTITGGPSVKTSVWAPGNGRWLYVFKPKRSVKYSKIRIKYVLPPKPEDRVYIRFKNVPI